MTKREEFYMNNLNDINYLKQLLAKYDGDHSVIYPIIKNRISELSESEGAFMNEFMFFEDDYMKYRIHMDENNIKCKDVIDIGCQLGFQSCMFDEFNYTGVDRCKPTNFFEAEKHHYIICNFISTELELKDKIVISNMSLGYFNQPEENEAIAEKLSKAEHLYIAAPERLTDLLDSKFTYREMITDNKDGIGSCRYYFTNVKNK